MNPGVSRMSKSTVPISTSSSGRQMKLRPKISGCSVRMKTPTRHSGKPACTMRSQISSIIRGELTADLAPSISQSVSFCRCGIFMALHLRRKFGRRQDTSTVVDPVIASHRIGAKAPPEVPSLRAERSNPSHREERMDCFASLAMTITRHAYKSRGAMRPNRCIYRRAGGMPDRTVCIWCMRTRNATPGLTRNPAVRLSQCAVQAPRWSP